MTSALDLQIHFPTTMEMVATGELVGPTLLQLTSFAGTLPLGPGDVVRLTHGPAGPVATGVEDVKPQWIVEIHAHTPKAEQSLDTEEWEASVLAADAMVEKLAEFPHMLRTTRHSALITSGSWGRVDSFIRANSTVGHYEVYRAGTVKTLDWGLMMADQWGMERPLLDRTGSRVD